MTQKDPDIYDIHTHPHRFQEIVNFQADFGRALIVMTIKDKEDTHKTTFSMDVFDEIIVTAEEFRAGLDQKLKEHKDESRKRMDKFLAEASPEELKEYSEKKARERKELNEKLDSLEF